MITLLAMNTLPIPEPLSPRANASPVRGSWERPSIQTRSRRPFARFVSASWAIQIAALVAICAWIFFDGRFPQTIVAFLNRIGSLLTGESMPLGASTWRLWMLAILAGGILISGIGTVCGLAAGSPKQRRIGAWFAVVAMAAAWLTIGITWPDLAWSGQRWRLARQVNSLNAVAETLRTDWPTQDGELPDVGVFMTYPREAPSILLVIARPDFSRHVGFTAVERSEKGALRFEMAGGETGAWLEWHPDGSTPHSFVGGLATDYQLRRSEPVAPNWYVTRYRAQRQ